MQQQYGGCGVGSAAAAQQYHRQGLGAVHPSPEKDRYATIPLVWFPCLSSSKHHAVCTEKSGLDLIQLCAVTVAGSFLEHVRRVECRRVTLLNLQFQRATVFDLEGCLPAFYMGEHLEGCLPAFYMGEHLEGCLPAFVPSLI